MFYAKTFRPKDGRSKNKYEFRQFFMYDIWYEPHVRNRYLGQSLKTVKPKTMIDRRGKNLINCYAFIFTRVALIRFGCVLKVFHPCINWARFVSKIWSTQKKNVHKSFRLRVWRAEILSNFLDVSILPPLEKFLRAPMVIIFTVLMACEYTMYLC